MASAPTRNRLAVMGLVAVVTLALVVIGSVQAPTRVSAGEMWCWDDPLVSIDGQIIDLTIGVNATRDEAKAAIQSADFRIHVAPGTNVSVLLITNLLFPQTVTWVFDGVRLPDGSQQARVDVVFRSTATLPVALYVTKVTLTGRSPLSMQTYYGTTTSGVSAAFSVPSAQTKTPLAAFAALVPTASPTPAPTKAPTVTPMPGSRGNGRSQDN